MTHMTLYLCDREVPECKGHCSVECLHTTKSKHAINGPCADPVNHRERFRCVSVDYGDETFLEFWERLSYRKREDSNAG